MSSTISNHDKRFMAPKGRTSVHYLDNKGQTPTHTGVVSATSLCVRLTIHGEEPPGTFSGTPWTSG